MEQNMKADDGRLTNRLSARGWVGRNTAIQDIF